MADPKIELQAYCKMVLHAAKYPHAAVNGLLLAKSSDKADDGDDTGNKKTHTVIVDAVPLFHQALGLAPMLEIALSEIDAFCIQNGFVIAGYYQANENFESSSPDNIAFRIADKINSFFSQSLLVMLDNHKVSPLATSVAYRLWLSSGDQEWREQRVPSDERLLETTSSLLENKCSRDIVDFDNHLDDLKLDWRNLELNRIIQEMSA